MEKHIKLVGILNIAYRSLTLIAALVMFIIAACFTNIIDLVLQFRPHELHNIPPVVYTIVPVVLTCIGLLVLIVSVAGIVGGAGVLKRKEWGRITLLIVSFISLLRFPLGTALGIYSIWALLKDDVIREFSHGSVAAPKKKK
jgi:xanthine/uracil permease